MPHLGILGLRIESPKTQTKYHATCRSATSNDENVSRLAVNGLGLGLFFLSPMSIEHRVVCGSLRNT
jgi:hypothetical protein